MASQSNQSQEGREQSVSPVFRYSVGVKVGAHVSIVCTSIDGSGIAMFDDFINEGNRIPSIVDYEGDRALSALTRIVDERMREISINNYDLNVRRSRME